MFGWHSEEVGIHGELREGASRFWQRWSLSDTNCGTCYVSGPMLEEMCVRFLVSSTTRKEGGITI
jgi:hypothetical protein